jgi:hypothetical protein
MKLFSQKGEFKAAVRAYVQMHGARADQDTFRLDVIGAALYHGLCHANFAPGTRVAEATLGAIPPDTQRAMAACRKVWEDNGKVNFTESEASAKAQELLEPVATALRELRAAQDKGKEERKQAKDAAARAEQLAKREEEQKGQPSPWKLKGPDGEYMDLSEEEYTILLSVMVDVRAGKWQRPVLQRGARQVQAA